MHWRRSAEAEHRFVYPVMYFRLDLSDKLPASHWFKHNRFGLYSFFDNDHGSKDKPEQASQDWFFEQLNDAHVDDDMLQRIDRVDIITQPRVLGFVFNPVSFWLAFDADNQLVLALAEVNNTFGVRLSYLLTVDNQQRITKQQLLNAPKLLHVSPFFEVKGSYQFRFDITDDKAHILINYYREASSGEVPQGTTPTLATTLNVTASPLTDKQLAKTFWKYGLSTLLVVARIHWQALKLKLKGATFHSSPPKPQQEMHHESTRTHG